MSTRLSPWADRIATVRGWLPLGVAGTVGVAGLAEAVHHAVLQTGPLPWLPTSRLTRGLTSLAYRSTRRLAVVAGEGSDHVLARAERWARGGVDASKAPMPSLPLGLRAALNGVLGDRLEAMQHPEAIPMSLERHRRSAVHRRSPGAQDAQVVFVHGLCLHEGPWQTGDGVCFGEQASRELGLRPWYLRYNSGLPIVENGRRLAALLERRCTRSTAWRGPIHVVAHSLGGLVVRSALAEGMAREHRWVRAVGQVVFLGTPHGGAPLERWGTNAESLMALSRFAAPWIALARLRSAAIRQLGHAAVPSLPANSGIRFHAVAGTLAPKVPRAVSAMVGDGLVPLSSALAEGMPERVMVVRSRITLAGIGHLALLRHPDVAEALLRLLAQGRAA